MPGRSGEAVVIVNRETALTFVGSLAVSFETFDSPPPDTVTVLVITDGASIATFTVRVIGGYFAAEASVSEREQVSEASLQFHPVPAIAVAVRPGGNVSVSVTSPIVGP
jgi:hypothetical protein